MPRDGMSEHEVRRLCDTIRQTSFEIHVFLRQGHLEKIYEKALVHRLRKLGLEVQPQHPLPVYDQDGTLLGDFYADLFVEGALIVELKACRNLIDEHIAQILGYLRAGRIQHGLLISFGAPRLQIRKFILNDIED